MNAQNLPLDRIDVKELLADAAFPYTLMAIELAENAVCLTFHTIESARQAADYLNLSELSGVQLKACLSPTLDFVYAPGRVTANLLRS